MAVAGSGHRRQHRGIYVTGDVRPRFMTDLVTRFGSGSSGGGRPAPETGATLSVADRMVPTRAVGILMDALRGRESPMLLDLGRVVGENVAFFTSRFACRLVVADLFADLDERSSAGERDGDRTGEWVAERIRAEPESVDAVLCWDTLEHLTAVEGQALAARLTRVLRPHGVLLLSFSGEWNTQPGYATYGIVDRSTLRRQFCAGASRQMRVLTSREVTETFRNLSIVDACLLATRAQEMVFRKPSYSTVTRKGVASRARLDV